MDYAEIGRQFGLNEAQTRAAFEQLAPVVAAGIRRNNQTDDGLGNLIKALQTGNHSRYTDDPSSLQSGQIVDDGNAILGHVFGSRDVSRGVANQAADLSGVGSAVLKKMLPVIAAIIMGQLAKRMGGGGAVRAPQDGSTGGPAGGGLGDILGDILRGGRQGESAPTPKGGTGGLGEILGDILGGGGSPGAPAPGGSANAPRPQPGSVSLDDLLREMMGGDQGGGINRDVADRSRQRIDDVLGGGTKTGNAADDLLNSVDRMTRRR
jgi:hypothetical protein